MTAVIMTALIAGISYLMFKLHDTILDSFKGKSRLYRLGCGLLLSFIYVTMVAVIIIYGVFEGW